MRNAQCAVSAEREARSRGSAHMQRTARRAARLIHINTMHVCAIPGDVAASKQQEGAPPGKVSQAITFVKEMFFGCAKACMSILKNKFSSKKKPTVSSPRAEFGEMLDFYRLKQVQAPQGFFLTPSALRCSMPLLFVVSVHWCFKGC